MAKHSSISLPINVYIDREGKAIAQREIQGFAAEIQKQLNKESAIGLNSGNVVGRAQKAIKSNHEAQRKRAEYLVTQQQMADMGLDPDKYLGQDKWGHAEAVQSAKREVNRMKADSQSAARQLRSDVQGQNRQYRDETYYDKQQIQLDRKNEAARIRSQRSLNREVNAATRGRLSAENRQYRDETYYDKQTLAADKAAARSKVQAENRQYRDETYYDKQQLRAEREAAREAEKNENKHGFLGLLMGNRAAGMLRRSGLFRGGGAVAAAYGVGKIAEASREGMYTDIRYASQWNTHGLAGPGMTDPLMKSMAVRQGSIAAGRALNSIITSVPVVGPAIDALAGTSQMLDMNQSALGRSVGGYQLAVNMSRQAEVVRAQATNRAHEVAVTAREEFLRGNRQRRIEILNETNQYHESYKARFYNLFGHQGRSKNLEAELLALSDAESKYRKENAPIEAAAAANDALMVGVRFSGEEYFGRKRAAASKAQFFGDQYSSFKVGIQEAYFNKRLQTRARINAATNPEDRKQLAMVEVAEMDSFRADAMIQARQTAWFKSMGEATSVGGALGFGATNDLVNQTTYHLAKTMMDAFKTMQGLDSIGPEGNPNQDVAGRKPAYFGN